MALALMVKKQHSASFEIRKMEFGAKNSTQIGIEYAAEGKMNDKSRMHV